MRMYLIRHGERDISDEAGADDGLTDEGRRQVAALADWMIDKDEIPTVLLVSPAARTQETAQILCDAFNEAGLVPPDCETDYTIGPDMSVRGAVLDAAKDNSKVRVGIVSHHESMEHGLRVLNLEPWIHLDIFAMGECRIIKVKRKTGRWKEHRRIAPSDLGFPDNY